MVSDSNGSPIIICEYDDINFSEIDDEIDLCKNNLRVDVQRCPDVPTAPNNTALRTYSGSESGITIIALFPPNSKRDLPKRLATASPIFRPI